MFVDLTGVFCCLYIYCLSYNAMRKYTVICTCDPAGLPLSLCRSHKIHNLIKRIELFLLPVKKLRVRRETMIKDLGGQFPTLISPRDLGEITSVCWETATLPQAANIFAQVKSRSETSPLFKIFKKDSS